MPHHSTFLVPVVDRWLLHAPLHGVSALINAAAADDLRHGRGGLAGASTREARELAQALAGPQVRPPQPRTGPVSPSFLGITPTRGCNIGCVYCNFGGPTAAMEHMDPAIAVAAVDWMADQLVRAGRRRLNIHFFGGEPFVSPDIVDIVVHHARAVCAARGLVPWFDASTNGVFDAERCRFVGDYFDSVVLSFDGPARFHDRNRPAFRGKPTFAIVERTARRLSEMPIELCLRVCITQDSVAHMEEITRWMATEFRPAIVNFESLTPGVLAERAGLRVPDPYEFARHCVGSYRVAEELGIRAVYSAAETERVRLSFCPVGTDALIVTPDGRVSACYLLPEDWRARGLDLDVGRVGANGTMDLDFAALTRARELPADKPHCQRCLAQWSCAGGCHVNHTYPGCQPEYDAFCIQTRIVTTCLLLREMGEEALVDELLASQPAMMALALHASDVLALPAGSAPSFAVPLAEAADVEPVGSLVARGLTALG